jgi:hypothetical protein
VSNPIRYDSLLVHYLAEALRARLSGRACRALPLRLSEHAAALPLEGGEAILFDLHPARGSVRVVPWPGVADGPDAELVGFHAPEDERRLELRARGGARFRPVERTLIAELHTHHWNLLVTDAEGRIVFAMRARAAGGRALQTGAPYRPPEPLNRITAPDPGSEEHALRAWTDTVRGTAPPERLRAVQRRFAWLGALNAGPVLGDLGSEDDPTDAQVAAAFERWLRLARLPPADPVLLRLPAGPHPYPVPLPGVEAVPVPDLLRGFDLAAESGDTVSAAPSSPAEDAAAAALAPLRRRAGQLRARAARLRERLAGAADAPRTRLRGDLLLANIPSIPRGAAVARLRDWEGAEIEIPLDPSRSVPENADRWYREARAQERAAARVPDLLHATESELGRIDEALAEVERGGAVPAALLQAAATASRAAAAGGGGEGEPRLPYRVFRTSGGLEVRVGRGSADNDRLTFHHSRPNDVWLHARSVAGSHVVLRWGRADQAPPAAELAEAAGLAAWFSKARTSGLVPVDWTRRKHVRKPRGAAPGLVLPQRVKTVFVEPDPELERRLAVEEDLLSGEGSHER